MKKKILYIGNKLAGHGFTPSSIDTLGIELAKHHNVVFASEKKNKALRLSEMIYKTVRHKNSVDVILIDTYSSQNFWYAYLVAYLSRLFGLLYIPLLHGGNLPERLQSSPSAISHILKNAYLIVSPSNYLKEIFVKSGFSVEVIPNAIPLENYPFLQREKLGPRILWVRSFHQIYDPLLAIDVFRLLKVQFPKATLGMVGPDKDGSMAKTKKKVAHYALGEDVVFTGALSKEEWIKFSMEFDIFLNTSSFDNQPVTLIEAMALGLPIITSNVGGIPFLIDHGVNGILIGKPDPELYAREIVRLISDQEKAKKMALEGRLRAEAYDWKKVRDQWNDLLGSLP